METAWEALGFCLLRWDLWGFQVGWDRVLTAGEFLWVAEGRMVLVLAAGSSGYLLLKKTHGKPGPSGCICPTQNAADCSKPGAKWLQIFCY